MYAYFKKLDYFSTECIYSPNAYRGYARTFLKDLEAIRPSSILDIIYSGESYAIKEDLKVGMKAQGTCERCGYISSNSLCKACVLLEGLNRGLPKLGVGNTDKNRKKHGLDDEMEKGMDSTTPHIQHMKDLMLSGVIKSCQ